MSIRRSAVAAILAFAFAAGAAQAAAPYRDSRWGFEVTAPPGWAATPVTDDGDIRADVRPVEGSKGTCNITAADAADLAGLTQAAVDAKVRAMSGTDRTAKSLRDMGLDPQNVSETLVAHDGHPALFADATVVYGEMNLRVQDMYFAVPGRFYEINCMSLVEQWDEVEALIGGVFRDTHAVR